MSFCPLISSSHYLHVAMVCHVMLWNYQKDPSPRWLLAIKPFLIMQYLTLYYQENLTFCELPRYIVVVVIL